MARLYGIGGQPSLTVHLHNFLAKLGGIPCSVYILLIVKLRKLIAQFFGEPYH